MSNDLVSHTASSSLSKGVDIKAWLNWALGTLFVVFVFTFQTGYAVTNLDMTHKLALTVTQMGIVGSIYTWAFAIAQFASGAILDKLGMRWVIPIACAIVTCGGFIFANATGVGMLVAGQILMALGGSFGFVGAGFIGGKWFGPAKYGLMFAWVQFVASLAAVIGQNTLGELAKQFSWDQLLNGLSGFGLLITLLLVIFMRSPPQSAVTEKWQGFFPFVNDLVQKINDVCSIPDSWINALIGGATFGSMLALGVVWGPRFLVTGGMDQNDAFSVSAMMWFGLAFGAPLFAWVSDYLKKRRLPMAVGCFLQLLAIIYIIMHPSLSVQGASVAFFVWGLMSAGSMLNFPIGAELVKPSLIGSSAALVNAVQFIIGGILMAIPGQVLSGAGLIARIANISGEHVASTPTISDYQWALSILPITLLGALLLFIFLKETFPEHES